MALLRTGADLLGTVAAGARGLAVEAGWLAARLATYPLGVAAEEFRPGDPGYRVETLPPAHRGLLVTNLAAAGTPILLLHGFLDNRAAFTFFRRSLRRRGFRCVHAVNYHPLVDDVRRAAVLLAGRIDEIRDRAGAEKVHIVGHSLGGIVARYYVQCLGGHGAVDVLATLGSPHGGIRTADWIPGGLARQIRPGSDLLVELAAPAPDCSTRFLVVWSRLDRVMIPRTTACLHHPDLDAEHLEVRNVGHAALPLDGRVAHWVATHLARSARDGIPGLASPAA